MSLCIYCNQKAGLFKNKHIECENIYNDGVKNINLVLDAYYKNDESIDVLSTRIKLIAERSFIDHETFLDIVFDNWKNVINNSNDIQYISDDQLSKIENIYSLLVSNKKQDAFFSEYEKLLVQRFTDRFCKSVYKNEASELRESINNSLSIINRLNNAIFNKKIIYSIFENAILFALEDGAITPEEEKSIMNYKNVFSLSKDELSEMDSFKKLVKSLVLRDVLNGILPKRMTVYNEIPFLLLKNETLIWLINDVDYYVDKDRKQYVGGSQGLSLRIAKGVYYRVSAFKGHPIITTSKKYMGRGILGFSNKHIYFFNYETSFRIRYDKIVSVSPNTDGFSILKEGVSSKQQYFVDKDGWFSYNLITNLTKIDLA